MTKNEILIWSDGSSRGNPGPGGWGVIIVSPEKEVVELGGGEEHTTNNRMELTGAISALSYVEKNISSNLNHIGLEQLDAVQGASEKRPSPSPVLDSGHFQNLKLGRDEGASERNNEEVRQMLKSYHILIHTDSIYVINGITKWVHNWRRNNWLTSEKEEVLNRDLWEKLFSLTAGKKIEWKYVAGHSGTPGNERCDEIATAYADGNNPSLYKGMLANYSVPLFDLSKVSSADKKSKSRSKAKAYSYLSMIDGAIMKHKSWKECEKRVKGKSGAKFKKALSAEDEEEILKEWAVTVNYKTPL